MARISQQRHAESPGHSICSPPESCRSFSTLSRRSPQYGRPAKCENPTKSSKNLWFWKVHRRHGNRCGSALRHVVRHESFLEGLLCGWPETQPEDSLYIAHQIANSDFERIGDNFERAQRNALLARFEPIEMRPVQAREFSKLILCKATSHADLPHLRSNLCLWALQTTSLWRYAALEHPA